MPNISTSGDDKAGDTWALRSYAHLLAAWVVAVVHPTLVLLSDNVELLAIRKPTMAELVVVVVALTLIPPTLLLGAERIAAISSLQVRRGMHLLLIGCLIGLTGLYALKTTTGDRGLLLGASALVGFVTAYIYRRFAAVRAFATVLLVIVPLSLGAFFLNPEVRSAMKNPPLGPQLSDPKATPVVLLILDELPISSLMSSGSGLNDRRFPHFAELARDATWFRNATTVAHNTTQAVPAIFTGMSPKADSQPVRSDHPRSIFSLLAKSHRVAAVEPFTHLCPAEVCPHRRGAVRKMIAFSSVLSVAYAHAAFGKVGVGLPSLGSAWGEAVGRKRPHREPSPSEAEPADLHSYGGLAFDDFLRTIMPYHGGSRPPLYVFHSSLPHGPWKYLPSGKRYTTSFEFPPGEPGDRPWPQDRILTQLALQRHLLQARFVDTLVGRLIKRLKASDLYDRSLVMVVADHGISFRPGVDDKGARPVSGPDAADTAFVPLFLKTPGQSEGKIVDRHVQTIDLLPTLADVLEARLPYRVDGRSLLSERSSGESVSLANGDRRPEPLSLLSLKKARAQTIRRQSALFGEAPRIMSPRTRGPARRLHGEPTLTPLQGVRAVVESGNLVEVRPESNFLPALVHGHIEGFSHRAERIAIEVNGRVAAVAPTYVWSGVRKFSIVLSETDFKAGSNRIRALVVES